MRILLRSTLALLILAHLGCCFGDFAREFEQGFDEGFCADYPQTYLDSCTSTCVAGAGEPARAQCVTGCQDALAHDEVYVSRCGGGTTVAAPPTTAPPPG